jgi:hypothetical protein
MGKQYHRNPIAAGPAEIGIRCWEYGLAGSVRRDRRSGLAREGYGVSLRVLSQPPGSEVRIHLAVPDEHLASVPDAVAEIRRGIEEALDRLAALVAG